MLYLGLVCIADYDFLDSLFLLVFCTTFGFYNIKITLFRIKGLFKNIFIVQIAQIFLCICLLLLNRNTLNPNLIFCITSATNILPFFIFKKSFKFKIFKLKKYSFNENEIKFFKYGLPIVLISFITFALSSSDQFFLKYFHYDKELSGYIANYGIAEKGVLIILSVMSFVFQPFFFKKHDNLTTSALKDVIKVASLFLISSFFIFIIVYNFSSELTVLLSSKNYVEYSWLIPIVVVGGVFIGLNSLFAELLTLTFKTSLLMLSYLVGFITNVILNYLFIPEYGITAAVWSSVFAYLIMFITTIIFVIYQFKTNKYVSV
jgi:O-antigen/teichoic acid export membrane protein